jgi:hypothetical protein
VVLQGVQVKTFKIGDKVRSVLTGKIYTVGRNYKHGDFWVDCTGDGGGFCPDRNTLELVSECFDPIEARDFYELMQVYRHSRLPNETVAAFEAVKTYLKNPPKRSAWDDGVSPSGTACV